MGGIIIRRYPLRHFLPTKDPHMKIQRLTNTAIIPTRATDGSAGYDLHADLGHENNHRLIHGTDTRLVTTGIACAIPTGHVGLLFIRSSLATKRGLTLANAVGVIDADYRGEIMVPVHNRGTTRQTINHGDRIAQLVILPIATPELEEVDNLDETVRGVGGFGSTGN